MTNHNSMRNYIINDDDAALIEKFIEIRNRGHYADSVQLQQCYNRVFMVNMRSTNCGSCIRSRITELENALNDMRKREVEALEGTTVEKEGDLNMVETPKENNKPRRKKNVRYNRDSSKETESGGVQR